MVAAAYTLASRTVGRDVTPIQVAIFYDLSGDIEHALKWLERSFLERDSDMIYVGLNPFTNTLRATPQFRDLVRRMNLPEHPPAASS